MKQQVVVMSAQQYSMVDTETGVVSEGTSVRYLLTDNLLPFAEDQFKGYKVAKASISLSSFEKFTEVPGIYEADLTFKIDSAGKVKVNADNFSFKKSLFNAPGAK